MVPPFRGAGPLSEDNRDGPVQDLRPTLAVHALSVAHFESTPHGPSMIRLLILALSLLAALSVAQIIEQPLGHNALWDGAHSYKIISSTRTKIDRGHEVWNVIFLAIQVL